MVLARHSSRCGDERTINPEPAGGTGCAGGSGRDPAELQHLPPGLRGSRSVCQQRCQSLEPRPCPAVALLERCYRAQEGTGIAGLPGDAPPRAVLAHGAPKPGAG